MTRVHFASHENTIKVEYLGKEIGEVTIAEYPEYFEPHAEWNEKATHRGIYESFIKFIKLFSSIKHIVFMCHEKYQTFHDGLVKRGLVRKIGSINHVATEDGITNIHMYQAVKHG